jgi:hypothetical protein
LFCAVVVAATGAAFYAAETARKHWLARKRLDELETVKIGERFYMPSIGQTVVLREQYEKVGIYFFEVYGGDQDGQAVHITRDVLARTVLEKIKA